MSTYYRFGRQPVNVNAARFLNFKLRLTILGR